MVKEGQGLVFFGRVVVAFGWDKRTNGDGQIVRARDKFVLSQIRF